MNVNTIMKWILQDKKMTDKEICEKAIQILNQDGHCKFERENSFGEHCVLGALDKAIDEYGRIQVDSNENLCLKIHRKIPKSFHKSYGKFYYRNTWDIASYNNNPNTTTEDIIALLEKVIEDETGT